MKANDGGPAFPVREAERFNPENNETHAIEQHWGMSLRDWFAGQALAGLISESGGYDATGAALDAYSIADAMLRARDGVNEGERNDAEDDEAWLARQSKRCIHTAGDGMSWASCEAGERIVTAGGFSRSAAIHALREKVEGGGQ